MWNFEKYFFVLCEITYGAVSYAETKVFYNFSIAQYCQKINMSRGRIVEGAS